MPRWMPPCPAASGEEKQSVNAPRREVTLDALARGPIAAESCSAHSMAAPRARWALVTVGGARGWACTTTSLGLGAQAGAPQPLPADRPRPTSAAGERTPVPPRVVLAGNGRTLGFVPLRPPHGDPDVAAPWGGCPNRPPAMAAVGSHGRLPPDRPYGACPRVHRIRSPMLPPSSVRGIISYTTMSRRLRGCSGRSPFTLRRPVSVSPGQRNTPHLRGRIRLVRTHRVYSLNAYSSRAAVPVRRARRPNHLSCWGHRSWAILPSCRWPADPRRSSDAVEPTHGHHPTRCCASHPGIHA